MKRILLITSYFAPDSHVGANRWSLLANRFTSEGLALEVVSAINDHSSPYSCPQGTENLQGPTNTYYYNYSIATSVFAGLPRLISSYYPFALRGNPATQDNPSTICSTSFYNQIKAALYTLLKRTYYSFIACPDPTIFSVQSIISACDHVILSSSPDLIIATYPYSAPLLAAEHLSKKYSIPWIADMRDAFHLDHRISDSYVRSRIRRIEKRVLSSSSCVVSLSQSIAANLEVSNTPQITILNSYDDRLVSSPEHTNKPPDNTIRILYTGTYDNGYLTKPFLQFLKLLSTGNVELGNLHLHFTAIGRGWEYANEWACIQDNEQLTLRLLPQATRAACSNYCQNADILLVFGWSNLQGKAVLTGKIFDYISYKKPVMAISQSTHDLHKFVNRYRIGNVFQSSEELLSFFSSHCSNKHEILARFPTPDSELLYSEISATRNAKRYSSAIKSLLQGDI